MGVKEFDVELDDIELDIEEDDLEEINEIDEPTNNMETSSNARDMTGQDIHDMFCESMDCEEASWLRVVSLDDIEYYNRAEKEGINEELPSFYKNDGNNVHLFVNIDELNTQPFRCIEILLSQLFEIYSPEIEYYKQTAAEASKMLFINKKAAELGYQTWLEFMNSYIVLKLMKENIEYVAIADEYQSEQLEIRYSEILSNVMNGEEGADTIMSVMLYVLGKFGYMEPNVNITNMASLKKVKFRNVTDLVDGETGKLVSKLFDKMMISIYRPLTYMDYVKIGKIASNIKNSLLSSDSNDKNMKRKGMSRSSLIGD